MDARALARLIVVDYVTVEVLQKGDIIVFDWGVAVVEERKWNHNPESIEVSWSSDGDTGTEIYTPNLPGSRGKWSTVTIINRIALRPPRSERKPSK